MPFNIELSASEWFLVEAFALAWGLVLLFAGYRLIRVVVIVQGFLQGGIASAMLMGVNVSSSRLAMFSAGLAGGLVLGFLSLAVLYIGIFVLGAGIGVGLGLLASLGKGVMMPTTLLVFVGLMGGTAAVLLRRWILIAFTSLLGSLQIVGAVFSLLMGPQAMNLIDRDPTVMIRYAPLLMVFSAAGMILGVCFQSFVTGRISAPPPPPPKKAPANPS